MSVPSDFIETVTNRSKEVRDCLKADSRIGRYIDDGLEIPKPFAGTGPIKLVIVGQDPTVGEYSTRKRITHALMLNENGPLTGFLQQACNALGVNLRESVYATNLCKAFFTGPPTRIKEVNIVMETGAAWLPILLYELAQFPQACVISLGEPVLEVLLRPTATRQMKWYWGHHPQWQSGQANNFQMVKCADSTIGRRFYPFIHLNTNFGFYQARLDDYLKFARQDIEAAQPTNGSGDSRDGLERSNQR